MNNSEHTRLVAMEMMNPLLKILGAQARDQGMERHPHVGDAFDSSERYPTGHFAPFGGHSEWDDDANHWDGHEGIFGKDRDLYLHVKPAPQHVTHVEGANQRLHLDDEENRPVHPYIQYLQVKPGAANPGPEHAQQAYEALHRQGYTGDTMDFFAPADSDGRRDKNGLNRRQRLYRPFVQGWKNFIQAKGYKQYPMAKSLSKSAAWQRKEGKNPKGGLNAKGRASAKREGHNLKPPVKSGDNPRRASFLARMGGSPGPEHDESGKPTRLLLALRVWGASSKADAKKKAAAMSERLKNKKLAKGRGEDSRQAHLSSGASADYHIEDTFPAGEMHEMYPVNSHVGIFGEKRHILVETTNLPDETRVDWLHVMPGTKVEPHHVAQVFDALHNAGYTKPMKWNAMREDDESGRPDGKSRRDRLFRPLASQWDKFVASKKLAKGRGEDARQAHSFSGASEFSERDFPTGQMTETRPNGTSHLGVFGEKRHILVESSRANLRGRDQTHINWVHIEPGTEVNPHHVTEIFGALHDAGYTKPMTWSALKDNDERFSNRSSSRRDRFFRPLAAQWDKFVASKQAKMSKAFDQRSWEKEAKRIKQAGGATEWEPTESGFDHYTAEQHHSSAAKQMDIPAKKRLWHMGQASLYRMKNALEREGRTAGMREKEAANRQRNAERLARYQANRDAKMTKAEPNHNTSGPSSPRWLPDTAPTLTPRQIEQQRRSDAIVARLRAVADDGKQSREKNIPVTAKQREAVLPTRPRIKNPTILAPDAKGRLPLAAAAKILGLSEVSVRSHVKRGLYPAHEGPTKTSAGNPHLFIDPTDPSFVRVAEALKEGRSMFSILSEHRAGAPVLKEYPREMPIDAPAARKRGSRQARLGQYQRVSAVTGKPDKRTSLGRAPLADPYALFD